MGFEQDCKDVIKMIEEFRGKIDGEKLERRKLAREQIELFKQRLEQVKPIAEFVRELGLHFVHPGLKRKLPYGPVLGVSNDKIYYYNVDDGSLKRMDTYSTDNIVPIIFEELVENCDFDKIMEGLDSVLTAPAEILNSIERDNVMKRALIEKYS
jgi:hypothetical protein